MLRELPEELLFYIFCFMDLKNVSRLALVCWLMYRIARDPYLLKKLSYPRLNYSASHNMKFLFAADKTLGESQFVMLPQWRIAIISARSPVTIRDLRTHHVLKVLADSMPQSKIAGSLLLSSNQLAVAYITGILRIWNADNFEFKTYRISERGISSISQIANQRIAISDFDNNVIIWDINTQRNICSLFTRSVPKLYQIKVLTNNQNELIVSFNLSTLLRSPVLIYNQTTFKPEFSLQDYQNTLQSLVSWPDGTQAGAIPDSIYIFEYTGLATKQLALNNLKSFPVNLIILPNGFLLSAFGNILQIWHNHSWRCLSTFKLPRECTISYLGIADSGDVIIGCTDGSLRAWKFPLQNSVYWKSKQEYPEHPGKNKLQRDKVRHMLEITANEETKNRGCSIS